MVGAKENNGWGPGSQGLGPAAGAEESKGWGPGNHGCAPGHQMLGHTKPKVGVQELNSCCPGGQGPVSRKSIVVVHDINGMVPRKTIAVVQDANVVEDQESNGWCPGVQWRRSRKSMVGAHETNS